MDGPVSSPPERRPDEPLGPPTDPSPGEPVAQVPEPQVPEAPMPEPVPWTPQAPTVQSPVDAPAADVDRRLAALEAGMADLGRKLERVGDSVEESVRAAVSGELRAATADLRHTVSELGRLLVRDLGKLAQLLADHRDTIVAELRPSRDEAAPGGRMAEPDPVGGPAPGGDAPTHDLGGDDPCGEGEHRRGRLRRRSS